METELEEEVAALAARYEPNALRIETVEVRPRKSDIAVGDVALVWRA